MSKSLAQIAAEMRAKADSEGTAYRGLGSGLQLHLSQSGGIYTLLLWRADSLPSQTEIETVLRDWSLPLDVEIGAPAQLVWVNERALDDTVCRVITWGQPRQVDDDPGAMEEPTLDRPQLRARPKPRVVQAAGIVGERWEPPHVTTRRDIEPDDRWLELIRWNLKCARERNDEPRIRLYQGILADVSAEAA